MDSRTGTLPGPTFAGWRPGITGTGDRMNQSSGYPICTERLCVRLAAFIGSEWLIGFSPSDPMGAALRLLRSVVYLIPNRIFDLHGMFVRKVSCIHLVLVADWFQPL